jgi:5'-nucleotidase
MSYDMMALGNNDFRIPPSGGTPVDGNAQLKALSETADFPLLCANVRTKESDQYVEYTKPYIVKDLRGVKVGIIGITSMKPQMREWTEVSDKTFESGEVALNKLIGTVSREADVIIVLSHAGLIVDTYMSGTRGISAVIGADDHLMMPEPIYYAVGYGETGIPIVQNGGEFEHYLRRLDLTFENTGNTMKLIDYESSIYNMEGVNEDSGVRNIIAEYRKTEPQPGPVTESGCDIGFPAILVMLVIFGVAAFLIRKRKSQ